MQSVLSGTCDEILEERIVCKYICYTVIPLLCKHPSIHVQFVTVCKLKNGPLFMSYPDYDTACDIIIMTSIKMK